MGVVASDQIGTEAGRKFHLGTCRVFCGMRLFDFGVEDI